MNELSFFPLLTDRMVQQIGFRTQSDMAFFYTRSGERQFMDVDSTSTIKAIGDSRWDPDNDDFGISATYIIMNPVLIFGPRGILCSDAVAGMAVVWKSQDSRQRGSVPFGEFTKDSRNIEMDLAHTFTRAGLRGRVTFDVVIYVKTAGNPSDEEKGLANLPGTILGTAKSYSVLLDGTGAVFNFNEEPVQGGLLWRVSCDFDDPQTDSFYDSVEIDVNPLHPNYRFINTKGSEYNPEMMREVITSAMTVAFVTCREKCESLGVWPEVVSGQNERGSVGDVLYYFLKKHKVDPESVDICSQELRRTFSSLKL